MSSNETGSYMESDAFHEAMGYFRVGKWGEGFSKLDEVESKFPSSPDLRAVRQEMEIRSRISEYELEENKQKKRQNLIKYGLWIFVALLLISGSVFGIYTYSGSIREQWARTQANIEQNWQQAQLGVEFHNAQQLLSAGNSDEAVKAFELIKAKNPDFPGVSEAINQAQALKDVETQYMQAMNLLQVGDSAQALAILQKISVNIPNYRDVSLQIKDLQSKTELNSFLQQADQAFTEGRYEDAVSSYESIRIMDPTYETTIVNENLFQSYIEAAQDLLSNPVPTLDNLKAVDNYFSQALAIKPLDREALAARTQVRTYIEDGIINDYVSQAQSALANAPDSIEAQQSAESFLSKALLVRSKDPSVLFQFQLAQTYLQAINDFNAGKWDSVVDQMEYVIQQEAGYANGTAAQTLYDTYITRGSDYIAAGEYSLALDDFQRASVLAQQLSDSAPLSFEAQVMIAEAQGLLNHYQQAVQIYQEALTTIGLRNRILVLQGSLAESLSNADYLASTGDFQSAFYAYRNLIRNRVKAYDQSTVVTVKNGDYLSMLARRYNTTVAAILSANDMNNQPRLTLDTQLIIPTLP